MRTRFSFAWAALALVLCVRATWAQPTPATPAQNKGIDPELLAKVNAGDAEAQHELGDMYYFGQRVRRDYAQAAIWYRKAAEQGDHDSQYRIGVLYHFGWGVPRDDAQAFVWIKKSAEQDDANAERLLSVCYAKGLGVPKDDAHEIFWLRRAAEDGDANSQYIIGWVFEDGLQGYRQDYAEAYFWLNLAASGPAAPKYRKEAVKRRDKVASHLTQAELSRVQERVRDWHEEHPAQAQ